MSSSKIVNNNNLSEINKSRDSITQNMNRTSINSVSSEDVISVLPESKLNHDLCFKIIIIGNCGVGKSSLVNQGVLEKFSSNYQTTLGFDFFSMFVKIEDKEIRLQIWDTCGQEKYRSLIKNFYRNTSMALMVYSIDDKDSFKDIDLWIKELKICSNPDSQMILIGNKSDLENRQVSTEMGKKFAENYDFADFMETSAKTGFNTQKVFVESAKILYNDYKNYKKRGKSNDSFSSYIKSDSSSLRSKDLDEATSFGCCHL